MSLGSILKQARERQGLSVAQVAEQTHMIHQLIEDLERDDFHRITASIYGRGFIKLFAECVGEEPGPLVREFNEIYSGVRRPGVKTRPVPTADDETVEAEPEDRNAPPPRPKVRAVALAEDESVADGAQIVRQDSMPPSPVPAAGESGVSRHAGSAKAVPSVMPVPDVPDAAAPSVPARDMVPHRPQVRAVTPGDATSGSLSAHGHDEGRPSQVPSGTGGAEGAKAAESEDAVALAAGRVAASAAQEESEPLSTGSSDASLLGELFDLRRRRMQPTVSARTNNAAHSETLSEETRRKIPIVTETPSWDDQPLVEGDRLVDRLVRFVHALDIRIVAAVLGGILLLAALVFGIAVTRHSPASSSDAKPVVAESAPPAHSAAGSAGTNGETVYAANLVPPPDSYVE